ncbi:MAG: hypothetical protein ABI846_15000 [Rudaea sp.]
MRGLVKHLDHLISGADGLDVSIHDINPPPLVATMPPPPIDFGAAAPLTPPPHAEPVMPPGMAG